MRPFIVQKFSFKDLRLISCLVSLELSNNSGATDTKMDGSVNEKNYLKKLGLSFFSKLD